MGSLKQSAYYAIGIVMMKGISLVMIPYITHRMTLAEYGSLEAIVLLADIGTILFSFGIVEAMYRYVGVAEGEEKRKLISNCFTLSVFSLCTRRCFNCTWHAVINLNVARRIPTLPNITPSDSYHA